MSRIPIAVAVLTATAFTAPAAVRPALQAQDPATAESDVGDATRTPSSRRAMQRRRPTSTAIHEAWLQEVLDLDMTGAIRAYSDVKRQRGTPERWLAVARLAELSRLGVIDPEPDSLPPNIPQPVREALELLQEPFPIMDLRRDPVAKQPLPALRPATPRVQDWVRNQIGPTVNERLRMRRNTDDRRAVDREVLQRWYANDILRNELEGRRNKADALRKIDFAGWQPPTVEGEPEAIVSEVQARLEQWLEQEESTYQKQLLRRLRSSLDEQAAGNPQAAVAFVQRLPIFAERLLQAPSAPADAGGEPDKR